MKHILKSLFILLPIIGMAQKKSTIIEMLRYDDSTSMYFVSEPNLYKEGWDTLAQPHFWTKVMSLPSDSCIINIAKTRQVLAVMSLKQWDKQTEKQKDAYRDSVRKKYKLAATDKIYRTLGKKEFYQFGKVMPSISKGIEVFKQEGVDPFYAQAILLIESPGKLAKSTTGAYGAFQLMKSVAISHGLKVNKYVDERKDFVKSAKGASSLIKRTCLPEARRLLKKNGIKYNEQDLWFKLFVLHIYHAGSGNVSGALALLKDKKPGRSIITQLWQTNYKGFKNASQNYSQLALASLIRLNQIINQDCLFTYTCEN